MSSPSLTETVRIRRATPDDAEACGRIVYDAFATINRSHNFPPELPGPEAAIGMLSMLFSNAEFYSVVAETGGRIVGSNCLDERGVIAGLGPVAVDPKSQNRGVGRMLMGFFPGGLAAFTLAWGAVEIVMAAIAGAWAYHE